MGRSEAVRHLLQARASPQRRNAAGQTAAQISLDRVTREVLQAAAMDEDWERPGMGGDRVKKAWK